MTTELLFKSNERGQVNFLLHTNKLISFIQKQTKIQNQIKLSATVLREKK